MGKSAEYLSVFLKNVICSKCHWFALPMTSHVSVCPECGSEVVSAVGRYRYTKEGNFFTGPIHKYVSFELKGQDYKAAPTPTPKKPNGHPDQPLYTDGQGIVRFKQNAIVRFLLDNGPYDLNKLGTMGFSDEDRAQFTQLLGYSLSAYAENTFVTDEMYDRVALQLEGT